MAYITSGSRHGDSPYRDLLNSFSPINEASRIFGGMATDTTKEMINFATSAYARGDPGAARARVLSKRGGNKLVWITSRRAIARHYMLGWFTFDVISIVPSAFDLLPIIASAAAEQDGKGAQLARLKTLRVIRVLRLIKLIRLVRHVQ